MNRNRTERVRAPAWVLVKNSRETIHIWLLGNIAYRKETPIW